MPFEIVPQLRVAIFGASGMVGAAVLEECLADPSVLSVVAVGRHPAGRIHPKLRELHAPDLFDLSALSSELVAINACFFTVGSTAAGKTEERYARENHDLPISVAKFLLERNPDLAVTYVSGAGADSTEKGRIMWARVKGRTENDLIAMAFRNATMFRLAGLVPLKGHPSKTRLYRAFYAPLAPILPLLARLVPGSVTTPRILGRAMIRAAQGHSRMSRLEPQDIDRLGRE
jgi:uncharacterized protein YbjT (DUF2867 family)